MPATVSPPASTPALLALFGAADYPVESLVVERLQVLVVPLEQVHHRLAAHRLRADVFGQASVRDHRVIAPFVLQLRQQPVDRGQVLALDVSLPAGGVQSQPAGAHDRAQIRLEQELGDHDRVLGPAELDQAGVAQQGVGLEAGLRVVCLRIAFVWGLCGGLFVGKKGGVVELALLSVGSCFWL